jgi:two-component system, OmpR family, sensor histidine kinase MprB
MGRLPVVGSRVERVGDRWHDAPIRTRLTAAAALASTVAIIAVVAVAYVVVRHELFSNIDGQLRSQAANPGTIQLSNGTTPFTATRKTGQRASDLQLVYTDGSSARPPNEDPLPVAARDTAIIQTGGTWMRTTTYQGTAYRILTVRKLVQSQTDGSEALVALQVAEPLTAADSELHKLRLAFLLLVLLGLGLVVAGTWLLVRRAMRPVATLTDAAEQIAVTQDLTTRIESYGDDELGRLASTFNTMLDALEKSLGQQRQLILDASHELRTPLASLRTNVEVLHDVDRLTVDQRRALLDGIVTQLDELTGLVADVVELARGDAPESAQEDLSLDDLVVHAVARARRHWPNIVFMVETDPVVVRGVPGRIDRAVANLLDNAGKFSPSGSVVDVAVSAAGVLTVADRGPGVPDEALAHVFDRFYRADEARALPGSGLGLAIVKQVVDGHRGTVELVNRPDGGAIVTVSLPPANLSGDDDIPMIEAHVETQPVG